MVRFELFEGTQDCLLVFGLQVTHRDARRRPVVEYYSGHEAVPNRWRESEHEVTGHPLPEVLAPAGLEAEASKYTSVS